MRSLFLLSDDLGVLKDEEVLKMQLLTPVNTKDLVESRFNYAVESELSRSYYEGV